MSGWNILACADMVLPMVSNGVTDMFYSLPCKLNLNSFF